MKGLVALLMLVGLAARADETVERLGVFVGANLGSSDDEPLRWAEPDARRMRALFAEVGELPLESSALVVGGGPAQVLAAIAQLKGRAQSIEAKGRRVQVFFYYSGHGDEAALHLEDGVLTLDDLRRALASVPGSLHLSLVDACRGTGRARGVTRAPAFSVAVPDGPSGRVELRASSEGESAQESDQLGASIFSHFIASALRGAADADGDGRITLAELYAYVYARTLQRTGTSGALQHPTLAVELAGAGEVVLARTTHAAGTLEVPGDGQRYLVFQLPRGVPIGELSGEPGRTLALPAGRFLVVRRDGKTIGVADVDLSWGGHRVMTALEFRRMSREELVARGGRLELHPFRLEPRVGVELAPGSIERAAGLVSVALAWTHGAFEAEGAVGFVGGDISSAALRGTERAVTGRLAAGFRLVAGRVTVDPSIGLAARWTIQRLDYTDGQRRSAAGLSPTLAAGGGALGPDVAVRVGLALSHHLVLSPLVGASLLFRHESSPSLGDTTAFHPVVTVAVGLGYAL